VSYFGLLSFSATFSTGPTNFQFSYFVIIRSPLLSSNEIKLEKSFYECASLNHRKTVFRPKGKICMFLLAHLTSKGQSISQLYFLPHLHNSAIRTTSQWNATQ